MLTSLIIAYFILHGGAAGLYAKQLDQLSSQIKKEVTVEATKKKALALVDSADQANKTFLSEQKKYAQELQKVLADRATTAGQVDAAVAPLLASDSTTTEKMVDLYIKLRPVVGAADWAKITAPAAPKATK